MLLYWTDDDVLIAYVVSWALIALIAAGSFVLYRRRNLFPISGREVPLLLLANFFCALMLFGAYLQATRAVPCWAPCAAYILGFCYGSMVYTQRSIKLLFLFMITACNLGGDYHWYVKHRWWMSREFFIIWTGVWTLVVVLAMVVITFTDPNLQAPDCTNYCSLANRAPIVVAVHTVVCAVVAWKLRKFPADNFSITRELRDTAIVFVLVIVYTFLVFNVFDIGTAHPSPAFLFSPTFVGLLVIFGFSTAYPVWLSFTKAHSLLEDDGVEITQAPDNLGEEFRLVIEHPQAHAQFLQFLSSEFSAEHLLFLDAITDYKNVAGHPKTTVAVLTNTAFGLLAQYIKPGSPREINISTIARSELLAKWRQWQATPPTENDLQDLIQLFDAAVEQITRLLKNDSFRRFKDTPAGEAKVWLQPASSASSGQVSLKWGRTTFRSTVTRMSHDARQPSEDSQASRTDSDLDSPTYKHPLFFPPPELAGGVTTQHGKTRSTSLSRAEIHVKRSSQSSPRAAAGLALSAAHPAPSSAEPSVELSAVLVANTPGASLEPNN